MPQWQWWVTVAIIMMMGIRKKLAAFATERKSGEVITG